MPEAIPGNGLQSTLAASVAIPDTVITIQAADAPFWPPTGTYHVLIFTDPEAGPFELATVIGGQGTAALTVTRASEPYNGVQAANAWPAGAKVTPVMTAAAMRTLTAASPAGSLYLAANFT
jgi:hypothetical protein